VPDQHAEAANNLDGIVDDALRHLGGKALGHGRARRVPARLRIRFPRRAIHQEPGCIELGGHPSDLLANQRHVGQPLPELPALQRVGRRFVQRACGKAAGSGPDRWADLVERRHTQFEPLIERTQSRRVRNAAVDKAKMT
jgi:hypothetical protein